MYQLSFLKKENDLNKIIKKTRRDRKKTNILFVSLWDKYSEELVEKLKSKYSANDKGEMLYVVDSFRMPHSFVIFKTTKLPHLVRMRGDDVLSEDYLPHVMSTLKIT